MQSDPILHAGGMNLYAYVGDDPVNRIDPFGLGDQDEEWDGSIVVTGMPPRPTHSPLEGVRLGGFGGSGEGREIDTPSDDEIVVVGVRSGNPSWQAFQPVIDLSDMIQQFGCEFGPVISDTGRERGFLYGRFGGAGGIWRSPVLLGEIGGINMIPYALSLNRAYGFVTEGAAHGHPYPGSSFWVPHRNAFGSPACASFCFSGGDIDTASTGVLGRENHVVYTDRRLTITQPEAAAGQLGYMTAPWQCPGKG